MRSMSGKAGIWGTRLQTLVRTQREQKLGLMLVLRQRLVPGQMWLHQRRVLLLVVKGRMQGLPEWRHQMRY